VQRQGGGIDKSDTELVYFQQGSVTHKSSWYMDLGLILARNFPPPPLPYFYGILGVLKPFFMGNLQFICGI
jgi:hypothetical protein